MAGNRISFLSSYFCAMALATIAGAIETSPAICAWEPHLSLAAGSVVSARIYNPWGRRCQAVLRFVDPSYLPITWVFEPINCLGSEFANFTVPMGVPNGDAYIEWDCAGDNTLSCFHVTLTDGRGDLDSTSVQQIGTIGCISNLPIDSSTMATRLSTGSLSGTASIPQTNEPTRPSQLASNQLSAPTSADNVVRTPPLSETGQMSNPIETSVAQGLDLSTDRGGSSTGPAPVTTGADVAASQAMTMIRTVTATTTVSACTPPTAS